MPAEEEKIFTYAELETQKSMVRVETLLSVHRDDFLQHTQKDEETFVELFNMTRKIRDDIAHIPTSIVKCRNELKKDIEDDFTGIYITKNQFNKLTYTLSGVVMFGIVLAWAASLFVDFQKLGGG